VLKETVEVVAFPAEAGRRNLDLTLVFEALERPLELRGEPAQKKGYGGLSFRFGPRQDTVVRTDAGREKGDTNMVPHPWADPRQDTVVRTDAGREKGDTNMVPHPWAELEGVFASGRAGARVTIDPSHPAYPNGWCLRYYGFLGVNYPGLEPLTLRPAQPLVLKYRVTVHGAPR